ncbi:site-specific DNA-methyltransferase [Salinivibrio sp. IB574]|uniref:site-specific DNA-methyltransferase n=1 Tax=Salinivibrio sp. IB574 TaxID=1909444 RepID=UPI0009891DE5|nr:DNA methyltransferase [Salinivibrio sp. IB574]OOF23444.1 site-specific DNA-methyltransferase [Salinivibrio sp. IB574]
MSRLTDLIAQAKAKDPQMGADLEREFRALSSRRSFGLNFERHRPENVELPQRPVRKGDKVRVLPPRGDTSKGDQRLWVVKQLEMQEGKKVAHLVERYAVEPETKQVDVTDLVVVAEFRDKIYPGLVSTGKVERGGDKPFHSVINGENYHALKALTFTHRGKLDAIYIDPPYNTGARDWKYNNDYVESEDLYRHSKWLAFIERRLKIAKELLNPSDSILIVTIDEKEYLRLGLLLEQVFPNAKIQMVSSVINPAGVTRPGSFARTDEYVFFVFIGNAKAKPVPLSDEWRVNPQDKRTTKILWSMLIRTGTNAQRVDRPKLFYPIFVSKDGLKIIDVGRPPELDVDRNLIKAPKGTIAIWPIRSNGTEGNWQVSPEKLLEIYNKGFVRLGKFTERGMSISYLKAGEQKKVNEGVYLVTGKREDGSIIAENSDAQNLIIPSTAWRISSHDASRHGSNLLKKILPDRKFPFPKSLYAVEDALRFFLFDKKNAQILDFFGGSGTTCHAVMRLNKQDGGRRHSIIVTNNEVAADEQLNLLKRGLRPGDDSWEKFGICNYITKPRIECVITGYSTLGDPINGDYKYSDEFPISDGFSENAEFFDITYESPLLVTHNLAFERIAPLLWLRAGAVGKRIEVLPQQGWEITETYGILFDLDKSQLFCSQANLRKTMKIAYIVTNDDRRFQSVARNLPKNVEPVRLYEAYLNNFQFTNGE